MVLCKEKYAAELDKMVMPGIQGGPLMHVIAAKAVAFKEALAPEFKAYQQRIIENAKTLAEGLKKRGLKLVSGGTDTHLMLVSFVGIEKLTGKKAEEALDKAGMTVNKNTVPYDPQKPFITSGIRIGTPAITTRGMGTAEMEVIADFVTRGVENRADDGALAQISSEVSALCAKFPLYASRLKEA
jgi:glycine hydroxymethyltransferase